MVGSKIIQNIKLEESALWKSINKKYITEEKIKDLSNFKSSGINFKISLWNPKSNGLRYLKTLIYNLCASLSEKNWIQILKIRNRHIGNPITIKFKNQEICLDYLQAIYEFEFIEKNLLIDNFKILEIGAGYGRTCHTILSNNLKINSYYILDLKNCLELSRKYLSNVLIKSVFKKIHFFTIDDICFIKNLSFDLCINI